ncbi:hypothetical protein [Serratia fonticola]|uniref:hypothetical protein n=1 Tax=Serratia fonticola TaxID=47917 RepID=UPI00192CF38F|nr:hypothetical protein [Serratia fonticola]MBL5825330.1 hypothetical protein [Serratia fonticola]
MSRLNPKHTTLRHLFLASGNRCAFPACTIELVNDFGQYVGNVCHIEAAEIKGERYNPNQSDEERRSYENLILLCANHHMITNDVERYPVSVMTQMKQAHEKRPVLDVVDTLKERAFINATYGEVINLPENLMVIKDEIEAIFGKTNMDELVSHAHIYFSHFQGVPAETREFFANLLMISDSDDYCTIIDLRKVDVYLRTNTYITAPHYSILESAGLLTEVLTDDDVYPTKVYRVFSTFDQDDMQAWLLQALRNHYNKSSKQVRFIELVSELNFNLLDIK